MVVIPVLLRQTHPKFKTTLRYLVNLRDQTSDLVQGMGKPSVQSLTWPTLRGHHHEKDTITYFHCSF